jgi:hypothetical protein
VKLHRSQCRHDTPHRGPRWKCSFASAEAVCRLHGKLVDQVASLFGCSLHEAASIVAEPFLNKDKFR